MYASGVSGGASALSDLSDVNVPSPNDNDHMVFDNGSGLWLPEAAAAAGGTFVDRGDPGDPPDGHDWGAGGAGMSGLTLDSTWRVLDISSVVPVGAKSVLFLVEISDAAINKTFKMRLNGNSNTGNVAQATILLANELRPSGEIVACDGDRKIEYYGSVSRCMLIVRGWWT